MNYFNRLYLQEISLKKSISDIKGLFHCFAKKSRKFIAGSNQF